MSWKKQENNEILIPTNNKQKKMLELWKQGKTFSEIAKDLNCSKSSVSYFFRKSTRDNVKNRSAKYEPWKKKMINAIRSFRSKKPYNYIKKKNKDWKQKLRSCTDWFIRCGNYMSKFGYKDVLKKYNDSLIVECYLTGDKIDLTKDEYSFDHIIPISRGGSCELDNLGITTMIANSSKTNMTEDEFVELCKKVLIHHGYNVTKE